MEIKWWMAALAGTVLALVPLLFFRGKIRPRSREPELEKIARLSLLLARGQGPLSFFQIRQLEKADPWVVYRVLLKDYEGWSKARQLAVICVLAQNGYVERSIKLLKSTNHLDRIQGAEMLGFLQSSSAVDALLEALGDSRDEVRWVAASALRRMREVSVVPKLIEALEPPRSVTPARVADVLVAFGSLAAELILKALNEVSESTRRTLIAILGEIGGPEVIENLTQALRDPSPCIRACAAEALGRIGGTDSGPALTQLLKDPEAEVRARAAQALGSLGWREALPALQELRRDENWTVRASVNQAVQELTGRHPKNRPPNKDRQ